MDRSTVWRNLGYQTTPEAGERAALIAISKDLQRFPHASKFRVRWSSSYLALLHLDEYQKQVITYERDRQQLRWHRSYDQRVWDEVAQAHLFEASKSGALEPVLTSHGCPKLR